MPSQNNHQKTRPALPLLTMFGFQLNGWAEDKEFDLTFDDVHHGLDHANLWSVLKTKIPGMDVSAFEGTETGELVLNAIIDAEAGMRDRERRKYGVEKSGLHLLLAYVLEAVQQHYWVKART